MISETKLQDLFDWLIAGAPGGLLPAGELMRRTCERLVAAGVPLWRSAVFVRTLHPDIFGRSFVWRPGADIVINSADFDVLDSPEYLHSPLAILFDQHNEVRYRLDDPDSFHFPFFDEMRVENVTDYIAIPMNFVDGSVHSSSFTTKQIGGFQDDEIAALRKTIALLARLVEVVILRRTATTLLETYVGMRAGERILAGQIRRGHTETMHAAIWLSDLRGFTKLSDSLSSEVVVEILDIYFDCQVAAILKYGGEVLKFMGDGMLAVFPMASDDSDAAEVCHRVLDAARECRASVAAMTHAAHADGFRFGLALHVGRVLYGNIGGGSRLDFTCIGPAVNLAARMEKLTSGLNRTIVASSVFSAFAGSDWSDLGEFSIAGFSAPERVYGLRDETVEVVG